MELFEANQLAKLLMTKHGLLLKGWRFEFDRSKRRFGACRHGSKRITLSTELTLLNDEKTVKDTILHEIAHALVGFSHGHDWVWKMKALEIGCNGEIYYDTKEVITPESKYKAVCTSCGHIFKKHRLPKARKSCGFCDPKFNDNYLLEFKLAQ